LCVAGAARARRCHGRDPWKTQRLRGRGCFFNSSQFLIGSSQVNSTGQGTATGLPFGPLTHTNGNGMGGLGNFLKKRVKKIKFKKGCLFGNFQKMGASCPINGREAWGRRPPAHPTIQRAGGSKIFPSPLPRVSSRINFFSYSRRGP
jgi:hypothetical protein